MPQLSSHALITAGMLRSYLLPRMALDQKVNFLGPIVRDLTAKNYRSQIPAIVRQVEVAVRGKLAQDADVEDLEELLKTQVGENGDDDEPDLEAGGGDPAQDFIAKVMAMLSALEPEVREAAIGELTRMVNEGDLGLDEPPPDGSTSTLNPDGTISSPVKTATPMMLGRTAEDRALRSYAQRFPGASRVRVDNSYVASGYNRPAARPARPSDRLALDAATDRASYNERFPNTARIKQV
jgi:hypothetical protein